MFTYSRGVSAVLIIWTWAAVSTPAPACAQSSLPPQVTLEDAVRLAYERNPILQAARAAIEVATADRVTARARPNPAVTFDSVGRPPAARPAVPDDHEYLIRVDQELETAGRRRLRLEAAATGVRVATSQAEDAQRRVELDVRKAYFQVVLAKADLEVARTTLAEIEQIISVNQARFAQGEISGGELRRTQVERLRFVDDAFASELALRNARAALLTLLNAPDLAQPIDVTDTLAVPLAVGTQGGAPGPGLDVSSLRARAVAERPDLQAAASAVERADTETRLQRALRRPNVTVGGGYSHLGGLNTVAFGVTVPVPLFNRNAGGVARADAEARVAQHQRDAAALTVALDVQQATNAVDVSRTRVAAIEREFLTPSRESRDIVLAAYRLGDANLIDLLDAQRAYRDTQRTYNRALFDRQISLVELAAAIGSPLTQP